MKRFYFLNTAFLLIYLLFAVGARAQVVSDTFGIFSPTVFGAGPIINSAAPPNPALLKNFVKFKPIELAAKGIVPGVTIYGIAFYKTNSAAFVPGATGTLDLNMRSGSTDTALSASWSTYSVNYFFNNYLGGGFSTYMQFSVPNSLTFPSAPGWIPLMLDAPFVYTGGCLEYWSDWESPLAQPLTLPPVLYAGAGPVSDGIMMSSIYGSGSLAVGGARAITVIYHSTNPLACNGTPTGGFVTGNGNVCSNADFTLYLLNPSAGPGISYQWQVSALSPVSWSDIGGATNASYTTNASVPKMYRANVTCVNSGITTPSSAFTVYPATFQIDSISKSITTNNVTFTPHTNLPISNPNYAIWHFGTGDTAVGYPVTYQYTTDGSYTVQLIAAGDCGYDTAYTTITIGCAGSPSFQNVISANDNQICPGQMVILSMNNNPPANYNLQWEFQGSFGVFYPIPGATNTTVNVSPAANTIYRNKATCTISGNFKYSNEDTIYVTPAPVVASIQVTNTSGNHYEFSAQGVQNVQTYFWNFGDGNTSTAASPSHYYPNAGTDTVTLIVTNTVNGCTDTATIILSITTGLEETVRNGISIYPNPASASITIEYRKGGILKIMDMQGRMQKEILLPEGRQTITADVSRLEAGLYAYGIFDGSRWSFGKLLITR